MKRIAVVGAGGFARELAWLISEIKNHGSENNNEAFEFVGYLVKDVNHPGQHDSRALGDVSWLETNHIDALAIGIGNPAVRLRLAEELKQRFPHLEFPALVHPSVHFDPSCRFEEGVILCAGVIATVNVHIAKFAMVNLSCTIGHETTIGAGSVLNPLVAVSGGVRIGQGVLVGTHATILQYLSVGDFATVGASSLVNRDVQPHTTVVGIPAREMVKKTAEST